MFIKVDPPCISIHAEGTVPTTGWSRGQLIPYIYVQPPTNGIWEFDFVAEPPEIGGDVLCPISTNYLWKGNIATFKGVKVYASSNSLTKGCEDAKEVSGLLVKHDGPFPMAK
jgi:hypothetical protein